MVQLEHLRELLLKMPIEFKRLLFAQILGWLAFFSTTLFFTDFIGQVLKKPIIIFNEYKKIQPFL
jgi:hypothetical protein